ncbi:MAG: bacteriohopanetetrol glucosamine biosynthesis glycosyltransferase HpnI [Bryobacterales bacterium]|nr:bacteriohopanetetrol glucosamine biosynthesis glycosyltransferase HpnI [Bryobacterales bacterium]MBV9400654.1 bacteriohopanetetrol glucosamine biosynthesis glycosyltransferase HpnI [Bryobacterales bacterium]
MLFFSICVALLAGSLVYSILTIIAARKYLASRLPPVPANPEPISILKPLSGLDLNLEANLRTFFDQEYPGFEILFAVRHDEDPAARVAAKLIREYPQIPARLLITGEPPYPNAKVYSLDRMLAAASHDLVVMSDSDIRVGPDLLKIAAAEFQDPQAGIGTCPYRAVAGDSFWSRLEAIGMNTDFMAGILVARMIEGMQFAVGPTIIARRHVLESIGGFNRLKDYLAEDFVMGQFAARAGHGVLLSSYVIEHHIGAADFRHNVAHRLRWVRSTRRSRPLGYLGQIFTMPLPLAILTVSFNPAWWPLLLLTVVLRYAAACAVAAGVLSSKVNWTLLPFEDLAAFCFWVAGFFGSTITWRGRRYRLLEDGRFEALDRSH